VRLSHRCLEIVNQMTISPCPKRIRAVCSLRRNERTGTIVTSDCPCPSHQRAKDTSMTKMQYSRQDIADLAKRMEDRAQSKLLDDMPSVQKDMRAAAFIMRYALSIGFPVQPIEIDNNN
jgi:hypothetical protein